MTTPTVAGAASAVGGVALFPLLAAIGIDPASMVAGLIGVVIVQTLMQRTAPQGLLAIFGFAAGSMFLASFAAPLIAPLVVAALPTSWERWTSIDQMKSIAAAMCGGFAQPILLRLRTRFAPAPPPAVEAAPPPAVEPREVDK